MKLQRVFDALPLVVLMLCPAIAEDIATSARRQAIEAKINAVLSADQPKQAHERYRLLFTDFEANELSELKRLPHDSIAIQAAWEEVALTVPERIDERHPVFRPDSNKLNWFIGFFEGRTRLQVPQWWADAVLDARANQRDNIYFPYSQFVQDAKRPHEARLTKKGDKFILQRGTESITMPNELLETATDDGGVSSEYRFSPRFSSKNCYVAVYDDAGYPYTLACVERSTGEVTWKSEVWGSWWYAIGGGVGHGRVAVDLQGDRVLVFGCSGIGLIHAEAFRADNGEPLFRFSNTYSE